MFSMGIVESFVFLLPVFYFLYFIEKEEVGSFFKRFFHELFVFIEDFSDLCFSEFVEGKVEDVVFVKTFIDVILYDFVEQCRFSDSPQAGECDYLGEGEEFRDVLVDVSFFVFWGERGFPPGV